MSAYSMRTRRPRSGFIEPTSTPSPPYGPEWVHEIKHDGYRMIARRDESERSPVPL
jgi:ATP-dependent DNA ligase